MMKCNHNNLIKVIIKGTEKNPVIFFGASGNVLPNSNLFEFVREFKKNKFDLP